jgi:hypothetical protein
MTLAVGKTLWRRKARSPLAIALVISLLLHFNFLVLFWALPRLLEANVIPGWLKPAVVAITPAAKAPSQIPVPSEPIPPDPIEMQFVEVDPSLITEEAPKEATHFSSANTLAGTPNPTKVDQPLPRIDGTRPDTGKTFTTTRPTPKPLPAQPKPAPEKEVAPAPKPVSPPPTPTPVSPAAVSPPVEVAQEKGVGAQAKPQPAKTSPSAQNSAAATEPKPAQTQTAAATEKPKKYKKVAEARAAKGIVVGEKAKLDGGVSRAQIESSFNTKASPFGDYSARMVDAVQAAWYQLLDERKFAFERTGQVKVTFRLASDGRVSQVDAKPSSVGENLSLICVLAVDKAAPFGTWPAALKGWVGHEYIDVTFTFNYLF